MNRRPVEMAHTEERPPAADAGSPVSAEIDNPATVGRTFVAASDGGQGRPPHWEEAGGTSAAPTEEHIDKVAQAVQRLLGAQAQPRLARRLREAPRVLDDADDICQLAAIAFLEAYRRGRIAPDAQAGQHTARSVAAYAWGICNRIFCNTLRHQRPPTLDLLDSDAAAAEDDSDARLWEVLGVVTGRCRPEDIVMAYLIASGASRATLQKVLGVSRNTPANALRRVGNELRAFLEGLA